MHKNIKKNTKLVLAILWQTFLMLTACNSSEQTAEDHLTKGKELFEKGEYDKALLELKTSGQERNRAETYFYMALLDEKRKNLKSMRQNLLRTLELDPSMMEARIKIGKIDILFGNFEDAKEQVDKVLKEKPENIDAQLLKATVLIKQGEKKERIK